MRVAITYSWLELASRAYRLFRGLLRGVVVRWQLACNGRVGAFIRFTVTVAAALPIFDYIAEVTEVKLDA